MARRACSLERFRKDTAEHRMTVELDAGMYRHLRFRRPDTYCYGFDIVTWPGYLAISGDMGASVFTRLPDMFEFFRASAEWQKDHPDELYINPQYWAEKCVANDGEQRAFSHDLLKDLCKRIYDEFIEQQKDDDGELAQAEADALWEAIDVDVLGAESVESAIIAMDGFEAPSDGFHEFKFHEAWEYGHSLTEYTYHFIWRLYAIAHAVKSYDEAKQAEQAPEAAHAP